MTFSGWYGNGTWALFRRIMKHKLTLLSESKPPQNEMYHAICSMFPAFIDDKNVQLTTYDKPGYFRSSEYKDYPIDAEFALIASEVRSMAMAAWRYQGRHYQGRQRRMTSESARSMASEMDGKGAMPSGSRAPSEAPSEVGRKRRDEREEENDKALIGYDSVSEEEEEDDGDDDGQDGDEDDE